jgi:hypothetical protein
LQADSGSSEPKSFYGPAEGQVFGLLRPLRRLLLQRHDPADSARRRDTSGRGPWGPVRFQSGNREVNLARSATPASQTPRAMRFSAGRRPRQRRGAHHRGLVPRQSHGGHRPGCRFPSASRRLRAPGLLVVVHSGRHSTRLRDARLSRIAIARRMRSAAPDDRSPMVYVSVYSGAVRCALTSRTSWSVCVAGTISAEGDRSAAPVACWSPGAYSADLSVRVQRPAGAQEW